MIGELLGDKETTRGGFKSKEWLENKAASKKKINKAGTFR